MASDISILYYTANRIPEHFARAVREELVRSTAGQHEIVSVSHDKAIEFGRFRHVVFGAEPSIYQVYRNVLIAARLARTPWVACCEDDTVYSPEHFEFRPAADTFAYDLDRWVLTRELSEDGRRRVGLYYWRERHQMAMLVCSRKLLIETLEERFAKYPDPVAHDVAKRTGWGEPGRYEKNLGLTRRGMAYFRSGGPSVTFNHSDSLMGRRRINPGDVIRRDLPRWGPATDLWGRIHG